MASLLLAIIYISFISLGLPDSLLGSAWPVMQVDFGAPLSAAGGISIIITAGTIVSSLLSDRMMRKFGAGLVNSVSVALTAVALFGFSVSNSIPMLCLWAIPYGLGAGAIDAALNNYVAIHFAARHMSWLHCFWGLGASVSPYIMSYCISSQRGWQMGYRSVSVIQLVLTVFLFLSLPLWKRNGTAANENTDTPTAPPLGIVGALKIRGVPHVLLSFLAYCAVETTAGLWAASYLEEFRGVDPEIAAAFASLFYIGITFGRFLNGFLANRFSDKTLIRLGSGILSVGLILIMLPLDKWFALSGLLVVGLGCAPIFPCIIHSTPAHFGEENSQAIVGLQMASAYMGSALMPPLFGLIGDYVHIGLYPFYMAIFALLMILMTERLNRMFDKKDEP